MKTIKIGTSQPLVADLQVSTTPISGASTIVLTDTNGYISSDYISPTSIGIASTIPLAAGNGKHGNILLNSSGGFYMRNVIEWSSASQEYVLYADIYAKNMQINQNINLRTNGWRIFVLDQFAMMSGSKIVATGTMQNNILCFSTGSLPTNTSTSILVGGCNGGVSVQGTAGITGSVISGIVSFGGQGGNGGLIFDSTGTLSGGTKSVITTWSNATHGLRSTPLITQAITSNNLKIGGGGGGGSGAARGTTASYSGCGGGGGGIIVVCATRSSFESGSQIIATGAAGQSGSGGATLCSAGGGGGGGGGAIIAILPESTGSCYISAAGGAGGNGWASTTLTGSITGSGGRGGSGGYISVYSNNQSLILDTAGGLGGVSVTTNNSQFGTALSGSEGTIYRILI